MSATELTITPRYWEALLWAEQIHRDQRRKGKAMSYVFHLLSVSAVRRVKPGKEKRDDVDMNHYASEDYG